MQYRTLEVAINPWEGSSFEVIARGGRPEAVESARQVARFPLSPSGLGARLPAIRRALSRVDLGAGRSAGEDERAVEEFAGLLYRFVFSGEVRRLFDEERAAAIGEWQGLRLVLRVLAPELHGVPWEVLWDILAFDLRSLKRGVFDLRVERSAPRADPAFAAEPTGTGQPVPGLHPSALVQAGPGAGQDILEGLTRGEEAFYSADFEQAVELLNAALQLAPGLSQVNEYLQRCQECLARRDPGTTVPPRAASDYRRAWEAYTRYRFDEAARWLDEAWLLAKDWGIAEWPEARDFHARIQRSQAGLASYHKALACQQAGDLPTARESQAQALRADPLEAYRSLLV